MKPSKDFEVKQQEEPENKVSLWKEDENHKKKPKKTDPLTWGGYQWLVEKAFEKYGKEQFGLNGNDFTVVLAENIEESFKILGGSSVLVLWGTLPTNADDFLAEMLSCLRCMKK